MQEMNRALKAAETASPLAVTTRPRTVVRTQVAPDVAPRAPLAEGDGYAFYDLSDPKRGPVLITVEATNEPVLRAMSEEQRRNWAGLPIEARPVHITAQPRSAAGRAVK